jgi:hypothetical protein
MLISTTQSQVEEPVILMRKLLCRNVLSTRKYEKVFNLCSICSQWIANIWGHAKVRHERLSITPVPHSRRHRSASSNSSQSDRNGSPIDDEYILNYSSSGHRLRSRSRSGRISRQSSVQSPSIRQQSIQNSQDLQNRLLEAQIQTQEAAAAEVRVRTRRMELENEMMERNLRREA